MSEDIVESLKTGVADAGNFATAIVPKHHLVDAAREITHLRAKLREERKGAATERSVCAVVMIALAVGCVLMTSYIDARMAPKCRPARMSFTPTEIQLAPVEDRAEVWL